jgi:hypothetical protein
MSKDDELDVNLRPAWARIRCPVHGVQELTREEYNRQMNRFNSPWLCGCGEACSFDDDYFERRHGI